MNKALSFKSKTLITLAAVIILVAVFFNSIISYVIDFQWFSELNYKEVFFKKIVTQAQFFVPAFMILFIVFFSYMKIINAHSEKKSGLGITAKARKLKNLLFGASSAVIAFIFSAVFVSQVWYNFLIFINREAFNLADPIFNKDIGFYIFQLPFLNNLYAFLMGLVFILFVINIIYNGVIFLS